MQRHREQKGVVFKARGKWYVRFFDSRVIDGEVKRVRVAKQLCEVKGVTKAKARELAEPLLTEVNKPTQTPDKVLTLNDFIERVYLPRAKEQKRPSTYKGYADICNNHLLPRCKGLWLKDVRTCDVQHLLDEIARGNKLSRNSLRHIKALLSAIFKHAKQQGYFDGENPVRDSATPPAREAAETYAYSLEEISEILSLLPEPAATIFAVAAFTGARRGEIRGMLWENYSGDEIRITQSVWESHITEPKTRKSAGAIPVIAPLAARLTFHRVRSGNPVSGPIFPSENGKTSLNLNNVLNRQILPALKRCCHCKKQEDAHGKADHAFTLDETTPKWHGWHAARRGLGTNLYRLGVPDKVIQSILRHAQISTTMNIYVKGVDADAVAAMAKLDTFLTDNKLATVVPSTLGASTVN